MPRPSATTVLPLATFTTVRVRVINQLYSLLHVSTSMASTGYGPSGASAAAEKLLIFNGKPGTFADFKFRFEIHIKVLGHVTVISMAIDDYRTHITGRTTRSGEAEARANKGMVESAAIAALLVPRLP